MDLFYKTLIAISLVSAAGLGQSLSTEADHTAFSAQQAERIKGILEKEKEGESMQPKVLSKQLSFIHGYNDTQISLEGQEAKSNIILPYGLRNNIQNLGGIQKTILNNKIQYNFYFWLVPKNFSRTALQKH